MRWTIVGMCVMVLAFGCGKSDGASSGAGGGTPGAPGAAGPAPAVPAGACAQACAKLEQCSPGTICTLTGSDCSGRALEISTCINEAACDGVGACLLGGRSSSRESAPAGQPSAAAPPESSRLPNPKLPSVAQLQSLRALRNVPGLAAPSVPAASGGACVPGTCTESCTQGGCESCPTEGSCEGTCSGGGCTWDCRGTADCDATCAGGGCTMRCGGGANCDFTCSGSGCHMTCAERANCDFTCTGGGCVFECSTSGDCDRSCTPGTCTGM